MITSSATISRNEIQNALAERLEQTAKASRKIQSTTFRSWTKWMAVLAVGVVATAFSVNYFKPVNAQVVQEEKSTLRTVSLVHANVSARRHELLLPAEVRAYQTTAINARIAGYLKSWRVDRGTRVTTGQVLAEIDAPEFDQDLLRSLSELEEGRTGLVQAQAERDQALANVSAAKANIQKSEADVSLAAKNEIRFKDLEASHAGTRQQYEEAIRNHEAARAELAAVKANAVSAEATVATREAAIRTAQSRINSLEAGVRRLKELEIFKTIVAPYDGIITQRNYDVGALVSTDGAHALFTIAQDQTLRVTANVPQTYAGLIKTGQEADVVAREFTAAGLKAKVARTAGAIDPVARTLAVELELPNAEHNVFPGAFVQIKFITQDDQATVQIPVKTLRFSKDGTQVFSLDSHDQLQLHTVKLGRDFGTEVEVLSGLSEPSGLVVNPSDSMVSGEKVHVEVLGQNMVASK